MAGSTITLSAFECPSPLEHEFWSGEEPRVMLPPPGSGWEAPEVDWKNLDLPDQSVVFSSSGSTGHPKLTVLTRPALLASARRVVDWLGITPEDHLICPLPLFHVGGFGMVARARVAGAEFSQTEGKWDARRFAYRTWETEASVTSLVPAQVFDLVRDRVPCPKSMRMVVVGGGHLAAELDSEARQLGWPILASFGMTEAGSQIATEKPGLVAPAPGWLPVLDGWEVANDPDGRLRLRGQGLFAGTVEHGESGWIFEPAKLEDGWFTASDFADLRHKDGLTWLWPQGRSDDSIKIRGELISLASAEKELDGLARGHGVDPRSVALIDVADRRIGRMLVLAGEPSVAESLSALKEAFNRRAPAFARIERVAELPELPRSALGKLQRGKLRAVLEQ